MVETALSFEGRMGPLNHLFRGRGLVDVRVVSLGWGLLRLLDIEGVAWGLELVLLLRLLSLSFVGKLVLIGEIQVGA